MTFVGAPEKATLQCMCQCCSRANGCSDRSPDQPADLSRCFGTFERLQWHWSRTGPRWLRTVHQDRTCTFSGDKSSLLKASITGAFLCACLCPSWPGGGHLGWWQPNHHQYIHPVNIRVTTPASRDSGAGVGTWLRTLWGRIWATHRSMQRKECTQRTEDPPSSAVPT